MVKRPAVRERVGELTEGQTGPHHQPRSGPKPPHYRVALVIETSNAYARNLLRGVIDYTREHRDWSITLWEHGRGDTPPDWLRTWNGDGIIARIETKPIADAVTRLGIPTVDVSSARLLPHLPWIETDDVAIAHMVVDHLVERGFQRFAFCGERRFQWSGWREQAFVARIKERGGRVEVFPAVAEIDSERERLAIERWLRQLPKPIGIMACYDPRGRQILDICRNGGIAVPDEVAVVGVDNDELLCELADPPLSSVEPEDRRTGYEAASMLDELMRGGLVSTSVRLPPRRLVARRSSDVLSIDDPVIAGLIAFIRDHACAGINVNTLLLRSNLSRRILDQRFERLLSMTPHAYIQRVRLAKAKDLLAQTILPLATIAERTGFSHGEYLSVVFKREFGITPKQFRERHSDVR